MQADVDAGGVSNTATGTGTPPTGPAVTDVSDDGIDTDGNTTDDPTETIIPRQPTLKLTKSLDRKQVFPFVYDITYTVSVRNTGNVTTTNIGIRDDLAAALDACGRWASPQLRLRVLVARHWRMRATTA
ncbi:MAG: hypothetical protein R3D67_15140 [Hyphomicrobiaceae bacterium]